MTPTDIILRIFGSAISTLIEHQDTTPEDKIRLGKVLDRMTTLESHEQQIADGKVS